MLALAQVDQVHGDVGSDFLANHHDGAAQITPRVVVELEVILHVGVVVVVVVRSTVRNRFRTVVVNALSA